MWNISLGQFSHIISSTGFPWEKTMLSLALNFYPIPTGAKLAGNKYLIWMKETEKWRQIYFYTLNKHFNLLCSFLFQQWLHSVYHSRHFFLQTPSPGFGNTFFLWEKYFLCPHPLSEKQSRGDWLLFTERMFSLRINIALFNLWHHITW